MILAYIPVVVFWGLDGFYLWQKQLYRQLYDHTRLINDEEIDYSMNQDNSKVMQEKGRGVSA